MTWPSTVSRPPTREANQPARAATATATANQMTENGPGARSSAPLRDAVARAAADGTACGQHVTAADAELGQRPVRAELLARPGCAGWGRTAGGTGRRTPGRRRRPRPPGGPRDPPTPEGPCTVSARVRTGHAPAAVHRHLRPPVPVVPDQPSWSRRLDAPFGGRPIIDPTGHGRTRANGSAVTTTDKPPPVVPRGPAPSGGGLTPAAVRRPAPTRRPRARCAAAGSTSRSCPAVSCSCSLRRRSSRPRAPAAC